MTEETKSEYVKVELFFQALRPDTRQYKQQSIELAPDVRLLVLIPNTLEYVASVPEVKGITYLTPKGMKYLQDQLEGLYTEEKKTEEMIENWDDEETKPTEKEAETSDDWGSTFDENEKPASNKPNTENWDEDGEEWKS